MLRSHRLAKNINIWYSKPGNKLCLWGCTLKELAVYAGTFDILTNGHMWMIERGAKMFRELIVAIGINPKKRCMFSLENRLGILHTMTSGFPNIEVAHFENEYLVDYASSRRAQCILRGIRNENDFRDERQWRNLNGRFNPDIDTVFLMPPPDLADISSSMVRELIGPEGWESKVEPFVPYPVFTKIQEVYHAGKTI